MNSPYIIITLGPPGAGKSRLPGLLQKKLDLETEHVFNIQIDDIIQSNQMYKQNANKILTHRNTSVISNSSVQKKFTDIYFKVRKGAYCNTMTCDDYYDKLIFQAIKQRHNIVFETTGQSMATLEWIISQVKPHGYRVLLVYSLVDFCTLLKRVQLRSKKALNNYTRNRTKPAPRILNTSYSYYKSLLAKTKDMLYELLMRNEPYGTLKVKDYPITDFYMYDNSQGTEMTLIYPTPEFNINHLDHYFEIPKMECSKKQIGGTRRRRRTNKKYPPSINGIVKFHT